MDTASKIDRNSERISFRMHPRIFAALGADLVTNDVVAVIELVKNSYDAFASHVTVRFGTDENDPFLEVEDDGHGMDRPTIEDAWCVVATPYRQSHPLARKGDKTRRVAGEKGLGRLSAARLGTRLEMTTKTARGPYLKVNVDWRVLAKGDDISSSYVTVQEVVPDGSLGSSGTRVRMYGLKADWDEPQITDLKDNLGRLISPFSSADDFRISLVPPTTVASEEITVAAPKFLFKPKYVISGYSDETGEVNWRYKFAAITGRATRRAQGALTWPQIYKQAETRRMLDSESAHCGPFEFEIRAWDIGTDDTFEIAQKFDMQKMAVRKSIRAHKGISVYRDDILVLPKSDEARDWLGLDLRRVSKVGSLNSRVVDWWLMAT